MAFECLFIEKLNFTSSLCVQIMGSSLWQSLVSVFYALSYAKLFLYDGKKLMVKVVMQSLCDATSRRVPIHFLNL